MSDAGIPSDDCSTDGFPLSRRELLATGSAAAVMLTATSGAAAGPETAIASLNLRINGEPKRLSIDPRQSLLDLLRETLGLTGTKKGCNQGACGACTVLADGKRITSCLALAVTYEGAEIRTIEGLAQGGALHPLQAAFVEHDALQCGYCTAGQIMSGVACIAEGHAGSPDEIRFWMSGNICRCGAYPGIVAAVDDAARRS